jgi:hypothetical protein
MDKGIGEAIEVLANFFLFDVTSVFVVVFDLLTLPFRALIGLLTPE